MGLIQALKGAVGSSLADQWKEYIYCDSLPTDVLMKKGAKRTSSRSSNTKGSENIITNGSIVAVNEGQCMIIVENGKVVDLCAEAGAYKYDTSLAPSVFTGGLGKGILDTIKTIGSRITYGGQTAKDQRVYFVNIKTIPGLTFGSPQPETIFDPVYGSVEITYNGEYAIKVDDPVILVNNMIGANPKDVLTFNDIFTSEGKNLLKGRFAQKVSEAISEIMTMHNVSFNRIQAYKSDITDQMNQILDSDWHQKYGIIVEDVALRINATDEARKIIQDMDADIAKTTRMGEVYSNNMSGTMAAATAEAMKNASSNPNGAMMGFMGMNMSQAQGTNVMGAIAGMPQGEKAPSETPVSPAPGTLFKTENQEQPAEETPAATSAFCPNCGAPTNGSNFCGTCGNKLK